MASWRARGVVDPRGRVDESWANSAGGFGGEPGAVQYVGRYLVVRKSDSKHELPSPPMSSSWILSMRSLRPAPVMLAASIRFAQKSPPAGDALSIVVKVCNVGPQETSVARALRTPSIGALEEPTTMLSVHRDRDLRMWRCDRTDSSPCALQMLIVRWWTQRHDYGPAEWLWRRMTYGSLRPRP